MLLTRDIPKIQLHFAASKFDKLIYPKWLTSTWYCLGFDELFIGLLVDSASNHSANHSFQSAGIW